MAEAQKPKNWFWNPNSKRWELRGKTKGEPGAFVDEIGLGSNKGIRTSATASLAAIDSPSVVVGDGGALTLINKLTGTLGAIAAVGSGATAVGTITGMTGVAIGDVIFGTPKAALAGNIGLGGFYVPTTNVVNAYVQNTKPDSAGSLISVGIDILQIRTA